jgi:hypothetical protein
MDDHQQRHLAIITPTQPTASLAEARHVLVRLLAGHPPANAVLAVTDALAILDDVTPPHPPLPGDVAPLGWDVGQPEAMRLLTLALDEANSVEALVRIGTAALELRHAAEQIEEQAGEQATEPGR